MESLLDGHLEEPHAAAIGLHPRLWLTLPAKACGLYPGHSQVLLILPTVAGWLAGG